jgi:hypothetical protein
MPVKKKKKLVARKKILKKKVLRKKPLKKRLAKKRIIKKKPVHRKKPTLKRKPVSKKKRTLKKKPVLEKIQGNVVGTITHYFTKVHAAVIKLTAPLSLGDVIRIKGHTTDFRQYVGSLQIDRVPVTTAEKGQEIGILADSRVRQHDVVYKV